MPIETIGTVTADEIESTVLQALTPIVLDFYQATCPPCRALEPRLERVAGRYRGHLSVYRVDIDRDMAVAEPFRVMSIPTLLILRHGEEIERPKGLITEPDLEAAFDLATRAALRGA
jgi:thioredoxin-like negative regulator of GroEL